MNLYTRLLLISTALACLTACGGGGGSSSNQSTPIIPIASTVKLIDATGGSFSIPGQKATISVPAGSFSGPSSVTLSLYPTAGFPTQGITVTNDHPASIKLDTSNLTKSAKIQLTAESNSTVTNPDAFAVISAGTGYAIPLSADQTPTGGTFTITLTKPFLDQFSKISPDLNTGSHEYWITLAKPPMSTPQIYGSTYNDLYQFVDQKSQFYQNSGDDVPNSYWSGPVSEQNVVLPATRRVAFVIHGMMNNVSNMNCLAHYLSELTDTNGKLVYPNVYGFNYSWFSHIGMPQSSGPFATLDSY